MAKFIIIITLLVTGFFVLRDPTMYVDENVHFPVTASFCHLKPSIDPHLTNIPAYHALLGGICAVVKPILPVDSLAGIRILSLLTALPALVFMFLIAKEKKFPSPLPIALLAGVLPIAFPFYFLVYTDIMALAAVLAAYYYYLRRSYAVSGMFAIFSVTVRQNDIIWLGWLGFLILMEEFLPFTPKVRSSLLPRFLTFLRKTWVFALGVFGFIAFIKWNGGISLAKAEEWAHPSFSLRLGNVFLFLILLALFYWPLLIDRLTFLKKSLTNAKWVLSFVTAGLLISLDFAFRFVNDHPYNQFTYSLHNLILTVISASPISRIVSIIPILVGLLIIFVNPLKKWQDYTLYPFSLLFILPSWLIEPRYYIVPYILFVLLQKSISPRALKVLIIWQTLLASVLLFGILNKWWFT